MFDAWLIGQLDFTGRLAVATVRRTAAEASEQAKLVALGLPSPRAVQLWAGLDTALSSQPA
ncbi:hypothetical protein [Nannocystis bainbridge]|uniref:Uncharacterized protein n=1 Tax=Nannocystis bainbridge TaxID=2995303 RepID=A0ABT5DZZ5_9BACT|nr:hypothetical protein [Nannocystis bainbridge]MDC0719197.1 hypothetical protein [Nannocystis bainbridge]